MSESTNHPVVREHPEQKRQEQTGREDATETKDVGNPETPPKTPR
jgi:hypothetical protein